MRQTGVLAAAGLIALFIAWEHRNADPMVPLRLFVRPAFSTSSTVSLLVGFAFIGVLYLLGFASEEGRKPRDAAAYYQRVFAIDIDFRDVSKRLKQMGKAASK